MEKLDANTIAKYICHDCYAEIDGEVTRLMTYHFGMHLKQIERGQSFKLICRPLSDFIKPCLECGKIPIVELAKMALMYQTDFEVYGFEKQYIDGEFIVAESDMSMRFIFDGKSFWMQNGYGNINVANNQLQLFEYLYENHFWLGDQSLFEKGIIIDKNTITNVG